MFTGTIANSFLLKPALSVSGYCEVVPSQATLIPSTVSRRKKREPNSFSCGLRVGLFKPIKLPTDFFLRHMYSQAELLEKSVTIAAASPPAKTELTPKIKL